MHSGFFLLAAKAADLSGSDGAQAMAPVVEKMEGLKVAATNNLHLIIDFQPNLMIWFYLIVGFVYLNFGYRWFGALLAMTGVFFGAFAGLAAFTKLQNTDVVGSVLADQHPVIGAAVGAVLLGILAQVIFKLALFLLASFAGFWVAFYTVGWAVQHQWIDGSDSWLYIGIVALAAGVLGLLLDKPLIIVATSILGATLLTLCSLIAVNIFALFQPDDQGKGGIEVDDLLTEYRWLVVGIFALLAVFGLIVQFKRTGKGGMTIAPRTKRSGYVM